MEGPTLSPKPPCVYPGPAHSKSPRGEVPRCPGSWGLDPRTWGSALLSPSLFWAPVPCLRLLALCLPLLAPFSHHSPDCLSADHNLYTTFSVQGVLHNVMSSAPKAVSVACPRPSTRDSLRQNKGAASGSVLSQELPRSYFWKRPLLSGKGPRPGLRNPTGILPYHFPAVWLGLPLSGPLFPHL